MNSFKSLSRFFLMFSISSLLPFLAKSQENRLPTRWEETIKGFEQKDKENPVLPGSILFVGSSSIARWQDIATYFPGKPILNRGFGGSNFTDLLYYADRVIYPYQPSKIFVYEGDNDLASGDKPSKVLRNAKKLHRGIKRHLGTEIPVIFISPKPSVARWKLKATYEKLHAKLKKYVSQKDNVFLADVWTPALGSDGMVFPDIFVEDNLHMNEKGYAIWQSVLQPFVEN